MTYTQTLEAIDLMPSRGAPRTEVERIAYLLMDTWGRVDPKSIVAEHPASYIANFADMARAVVADRGAGTSLEAEMVERLRLDYEVAKWAHDWAFDIVPSGKPANKLACDAIRALPLLFKVAIRSLSASPTDAGVEGWQDIASAPKDGTEVLITGGTFENSMSLGGPWPYEAVTIASYSHGESLWQGENAGGHDEHYWHEPTHWRPLPSPPIPMVKEEGSTGTANAYGTALSSASPIEPATPSRPEASIAFRGDNA